MKKKIAAALICLLLVCLVAGCGTQPSRQVTVTYCFNGQVLHSVQLAAGTCPEVYSLDVEGAFFDGWEDAAGQLVDPATIPAQSNLRYNAVITPELTVHGAYLQLDGQGNVRPDSVLTADELCYALETLSAPAAREYFPVLPKGSAPVEAQALSAILQRFFGKTTVIEGNGPVTRAQFASAMHQLLGRADDEALVMEDSSIPADLYMEHPQLVALLEASVPHSLAQDGIHWSELDLTTKSEPGFLNIDGYLYYVQEDRHFLRDGKVGKLKFGADGRYTSGDSELDDMVAQILKTIVEENPNADRMELLRAAYEHSHMDYKYLRRDPYGTGDRGWEIEDAKTMISKGKGNCYNFAAIFWALARGLGFEARAVAGTCTSTNQPHGWVIIAIDGADYFFDPEWQYAYRERGENDHDMFMIPMSKINYWKYKWRE